jgi:hypothetical protein
MLANIDNIRVSQTARVQVTGQVTAAHAVLYTIAGQGPYTDYFEDPNFTPQNVFTAQAARIVKLYHLGVQLQYPPGAVPGQPGTWSIPILPNPSVAGTTAGALVPTGNFIYTEPPTS